MRIGVEQDVGVRESPLISKGNRVIFVSWRQWIVDISVIFRNWRQTSLEIIASSFKPRLLQVEIVLINPFWNLHCFLSQVCLFPALKLSPPTSLALRRWQLAKSISYYIYGLHALQSFHFQFLEKNTCYTRNLTVSGCQYLLIVNTQMPMFLLSIKSLKIILAGKWIMISWPLDNVVEINEKSAGRLLQG